MGFEIPIDVDYSSHPKSLKMIALLGKRADVFPIRLWLWCAKFARRGVIEGGAEQIEKACGWDGKPGRLHEALIETGILEQDGKTVHDWMHYAGKNLAAYERKKQNQRLKYESRAPVILPNSSGILPAFFRLQKKRKEKIRKEKKTVKRKKMKLRKICRKILLNLPSKQLWMKAGEQIRKELRSGKRT